MTAAVGLYQTTIGKKIVMAATGVIWFGYVIAHMSGNLLIFGGPEKINGYSAFLHDNPGLLWIARLVLISALLGHVVASTQLTLRNLDARPVSYARREDLKTTYAARTMIWSGPILLAFLVYHILHLTLGTAPGHPYEPHDVYNNLVLGFRIPWVTAAYVVAMGALGMHLYHGAWSFFGTLGAGDRDYEVLRRRFATIMTTVVIAGFLSVPVAVITGFVQPAPPSTANLHDRPSGPS
jgi:succinate dehydrogenase / fumarate reductase cytochrome b subunit